MPEIFKFEKRKLIHEISINKSERAGKTLTRCGLTVDLNKGTMKKVDIIDITNFCENCWAYEHEAYLDSSKTRNPLYNKR